MADAPALTLPLDRPRNGEEVGPASWIQVDVPQGTVSGLESLASACGATLFMVLLAALQLVLGKHAGQDDVVVSSTLSEWDNIFLSWLQ